tara:strand:- start:102 stop:482 length:381 start_codon:yes stop_codon:yes gene_type:complete
MIKRLRYLLLYLLLIPNITQAEVNIGLDNLTNINLGQEKKPATVASNIINTLLTLLGTIAVIIILLGGFKWMTAGGSSEKVQEAKDLIKNGIIGLIIILSSWIIANFVLDSIYTASDTAPSGDAEG